MRLEDIVVIDDDGAPDPLNRVDHSLVVIGASGTRCRSASPEALRR